MRFETKEQSSLLSFSRACEAGCRTCSPHGCACGVLEKDKRLLCSDKNKKINRINYDHEEKL
jgi:hypothetical protein